MKKVLVSFLAVIVLTALVVAGCGQKQATTEQPKQQSTSDTTTKENPKIAVLLPSLQGYIYVARAYGIVDEAKKLGMEQPTILGAGGYDKFDVQVKQIDDMVASGIDSIIIMPLSLEAITPALDKAVDKGVKVVEMGNASDSKKVQSRLRPDQAEIGRMLARTIGQNLNGKGNIVMFDGPAGASWSQLETDGFKEVLKKDYPDIKILGERWTVYDAGVAMNTMNDYLQAFPDIDYVYCAWDSYAEGAARAIKAAGKADQIKVVSAGLTAVTVPLLKEGIATYVVAANPIAESREALKNAIKLANGEDVPASSFTTLTGFTAEDFKSDDVDLSGNFYPEGWTVPQ